MQFPNDPADYWKKDRNNKEITGDNFPNISIPRVGCPNCKKTIVINDIIKHNCIRVNHSYYICPYCSTEFIIPEGLLTNFGKPITYNDILDFHFNLKLKEEMQ